MNVPPEMTHQAFVERLREKGSVVGVHNFLRSVVLAWGTRGALGIAVTLVIFTMIAVGFAYHAVSTGTGAAVLFLFPALASLISARPGLTLFGAIGWGLFAATGGILALARHNPVHVVGGLLPLLFWFAGGALRGATMEALRHRLETSPATYRKLRNRNELFLLKLVVA